MNTIAIAHRPFAVHPATGLMTPDGIFDVALGVQELQASVHNLTAAPLVDTKVYLESVSDPSLTVVPATYDVSDLPPSAARRLAWRVDATHASAGEHRVSFIGDGPAGTTRIIQKIFVARTSADPTTGTFNLDLPQGRLNVEIVSLFASAQRCCIPPHPHGGQLGVGPLEHADKSFLDLARALYTQHRADFVFCPPGYLPKQVRLTLTPTPAYDGQYGPLPFEDPWWKIALCLLALVLLIAGAVAEAEEGSGSITVSTGGTDPNCCGVDAEGGGTSYVAAGLVAAAATALILAGESDERDVLRRGEDHTAPSAGELTVSEALDIEFIPRDPVALGRPFSVDVAWAYQRHTNSGRTLSHTVPQETGTNVHVLSRYEINAPDTIRAYQKEPFEITAKFFDADGAQLRGEALFVQCFLFGPSGQTLRFPLTDDGMKPDTAATDGTYTGQVSFLRQERGMWKYFVLAQDVNTATPEMKPEQAAQIIGGMVLTHQLTIGFSGGTCPLVPDGHVNVI